MGELSVMLTLSLLYGNIVDPKTGKDQEGHHWSYVGDTGPNHWTDHFPKCGGQRQSPVDIYAGEVEYASWLTDLQFDGYEKYLGQGFTKPITIKNNGHTASMAITDNLKLRGAHLNGDYKLAEMHLHWGSNNSIGSEHTLEGKKKPAEIHFVHYAERYGNLSEAMKMHDGLAVVAVFVELMPDDNYVIDRLCNGIEGIIEYGSQKNLTSIRMMDFLPMNKNSFYHYRGSLTTPPCYESVLWFVMTETISMSPTQLDRFRYLQEKVHEHVAATGTAQSHSSRVFKSDPVYIRDNYRPVQSLNGRKVYCNKLTLNRPRLSDVEIPAVQRTPINQHSSQYRPTSSSNSMSVDQVQYNSIGNQERLRTDYIYDGLSPNTFNQAPVYPSVTGVISNRNNLLIGSISSNDIKGSIRQHLQPDYKHNSLPSNQINRDHVINPSNDRRLHVFEKPETASVLNNGLNSGKAQPLLDYIFTQMHGLTRNSANNDRRYNPNDHPALSQPKDRIFGGLSDILTNSATSQVLSNPFIDNLGTSENSNSVIINTQPNHFQTNSNTRGSMPTNVSPHTNNGSTNTQWKNNANPSPMSHQPLPHNGHRSQYNMVPTTMYPMTDYQQQRTDWMVTSMLYEEFF